MKKLMMIATMLVAAMTVNAQEAGQMFLKPMVGGTLTSVLGDNTDDVKMKLGLVAGAEFGYMFSDKFGVTGGLLYTQEGCKGETSVLGTKIDQKLNTEYINVPILANYYIIPGLAVKAGIQPGFNIKSKWKMDKVEVDMKDSMKKVDFSIPVGLSYEIGDFVIDARYNIGLTKIYKDNKVSIGDGTTITTEGVKQRNSVFMLTLGYKIQF